jgi:hypothetical protein
MTEGEADRLQATLICEEFLDFWLAVSRWELIEGSGGDSIA